MKMKEPADVVILIEHVESRSPLRRAKDRATRSAPAFRNRPRPPDIYRTTSRNSIFRSRRTRQLRRTANSYRKYSRRRCARNDASRFRAPCFAQNDSPGDSTMRSTSSRLEHFLSRKPQPFRGVPAFHANPIDLAQPLGDRLRRLPAAVPLLRNPVAPRKSTA